MVAHKGCYFYFQNIYCKTYSVVYSTKDSKYIKNKIFTIIIQCEFYHQYTKMYIPCKSSNFLIRIFYIKWIIHSKFKKFCITNLIFIECKTNKKNFFLIISQISVTIKTVDCYLFDYQ